MRAIEARDVLADLFGSGDFPPKILLDLHTRQMSSLNG
jgi:hypothetical protein